MRALVLALSGREARNVSVDRPLILLCFDGFMALHSSRIEGASEGMEIHRLQLVEMHSCVTISSM